MINKSTEWLQNIVQSRTNYPQFNSPYDREELKACIAELERRNQPIPERQDVTDFKYRLERYGY